MITQGLDFDWCKNPDKGLVKPDLTFFIDANADTIKLRSDYGDERYEKIEFQKRVADAYGKFKEMARDDDHWVTVEAESKSIDEIHQVILEKVVNYMSDDVEKVDMSKMANSLFVQ